MKRFVMTDITAAALISRDAGLETRDGEIRFVKEIIAIERRRRETERRPEIDARGPVKFRAHHADHPVTLLIQLNRTADDSGIGAENRFPGAIGKDHDAVRAGLVFFGSECAAEKRRCAENLEPLLRDLRADQTHGKTAGGVIEIHALLQRHRGERTGFMADKIEIGDGNLNAVETQRGVVSARRNDAFGAIDARGMKEQAIHDAENSGVRSDAKREREDWRSRRSPVIWRAGGVCISDPGQTCS